MIRFTKSVDNPLMILASLQLEGIGDLRRVLNYHLSQVYIELFKVLDRSCFFTIGTWQFSKKLFCTFSTFTSNRTNSTQPIFRKNVSHSQLGQFLPVPTGQVLNCLSQSELTIFQEIVIHIPNLFVIHWISLFQLSQFSGRMFLTFAT